MLVQNQIQFIPAAHPKPRSKSHPEREYEVETWGLQAKPDLKISQSYSEDKDSLVFG